ncbi:MAG: type II secretion system secretin GspD [Polyangiaceae bacterium]|nr:type II secretion system secretin GspD [Polyangiaceae bacterium]
MLKKHLTVLSLVGLPSFLFAASSAAQPQDPPGTAVPPPATMDKIAKAVDVPYRPKPGGQLVKFNLEEADLSELVKYISVLTGRRFIVNPKLRTIKATVSSPSPVTLEEAYQVFLSILDINGMTVVPQGRFLKIVDSGGITTQGTPVIARGAPVPATDSYVTRLYRLAHISPDEAVKVLTKFKSKEGDLSTYTPGNLLIITDTGTQIARLVRILEEVDIGGAGQQMWIQPVNGDADDIAKRVTELFNVGKDPNAAGGLTKVVADGKSNSLIVMGSQESYLRLLELLKRLDDKPAASGKVRVVPVQHAVAQELATTLTAMLAATGKDAAADAGGMFEGAVKVTADVPTNSLIVTSSSRDYATLRLVLDQLDRERRQVYIEAVIMDLSVSDSSELGLSFHGGKQFGTGSAVGQSLLLGGFQAGKSAAFPVDATSLSGFAAGLRGPEIPGTKALLGRSIPAFGVVLNALASSGKSNILATPHIIATDNVQAEINIGENVPLQTNVGGSALAAAAGAAGAQNAALLGALSGGSGFSAPRQDVGNKIRITPHINESNQVRLEIDQESSAAGAASGSLGAVTITKRTAQTTLVVADQQTVVIGGLTRDEESTSREKVPVLGDIPVLGALFRRSTTRKSKANLLLILTPYVIRSQDDLRKIFERKMQERQEFLDRNFVFSGEDWKAPRDYSRSNGAVEDIRQATFELKEQARLEEESRPGESQKHLPLAPIELPPAEGADSVNPATVGAPAEQAPPAQATPVPTPPPPPPPPPARPQGEGGGLPEGDSKQASQKRPTESGTAPLRIVRMARSVEAGE